MNKKSRNLIVAFLFIVLICIFAYFYIERTQNTMKINNHASVDELIKTRYSEKEINQLIEQFSRLGMTLTISDLQKEFDLECNRKPKINGVMYSILLTDTDEKIIIFYYNQQIGGIMRFTHFPKKGDYDSIEIWKSSFEDIERINPNYAKGNPYSGCVSYVVYVQEGIFIIETVYKTEINKSVVAKMDFYSNEEVANGFYSLGAPFILEIDKKN